jgi:dihydroorotate dehydrogenase
MYPLLRRILFWFNPEDVHYFSMDWLQRLCRIAFIRKIITGMYQPTSEPYELLGLHFSNRVGLAAGFDKNAKYLLSLQALGFGFVEIGTVTPLPQVGNDKPRLFRLPKDKALINRMGFNNEGVEAVVKRLKSWQSVSSRQSAVVSQQSPVVHGPSSVVSPKLIIGGNIGKNKVTPNEDAWKDYEKCFVALAPYVDYFVVNVSSPNTPGLRELQEKKSLRKILTHLQDLNRQQPVQRPILLKIAPDLTNTQVDDVIDLSIEIKLDGLVVSNTTISREGLSKASNTVAEKMGAGGLSGLPLKQRSTELIRYINQKTAGALPIIGSGGIFTAADAQEKIAVGASVIQVWTGFIYEGPGIVKRIVNSGK